MAGIPFDFDLGKAFDYAMPLWSPTLRAGKSLLSYDPGQAVKDITGQSTLGSYAEDAKKVGGAIGGLFGGPDTAGLSDQQRQLGQLSSNYGQERGRITNQIERGGAVGAGYGPASTAVPPSTAPPPAAAPPMAMGPMAPPPAHPPAGATTMTQQRGTPFPAGTNPAPGGPNVQPAQGDVAPGPTGQSAFRGTPTGAAAPPGAGPGGSGQPTGPDFIDAARRLQFQNLTGLQDAATGNVPSAAEIQGRNMAARAGAQQFGLAAALQGGHSPGSVLRRAQMGAQDVAAKAREDAGALRAQEQATARQQLTGALAGIRGNEQDLSTAQAQLNQQDRHDLLMAQLQAQGYSLDAAKAIADAQAKDEAAKLQFAGGIVGAAPGVIKALSDVREKTDIAPANLDRLADALEGFTFRYRDTSVPGAAPGPRVGIMAQDALRGGPAGRAMVDRGGDGRLRLDVGNALGAALAMSAQALRRSRKAA